MTMWLAAFALIVAPVALCDSPETITLACSAEFCSDVAPESAYDLPLCSEEQFDTMLINAMQGGDDSALPLLEQRHDATLSYRERHRIAGALLGQASDDRKYWNELAAFADQAIRFAHVDGKPPADFVAWCEAHDLDPSIVRDVQWASYAIVLEQERGKPFLRKALDTNDSDLLYQAIATAASRRDESVLPAIKKAIARMPAHDRQSLASVLSLYASDAVDAYALPLITDEDFASAYREIGEQARRELAGLPPEQ
jgi:hypothetical protein